MSLKNEINMYFAHLTCVTGRNWYDLTLVLTDLVQTKVNFSHFPSVSLYGGIPCHSHLKVHSCLKLSSGAKISLSLT